MDFTIPTKSLESLMKTSILSKVKSLIFSRPDTLLLSKNLPHLALDSSELDIGQEFIPLI